MESSEIREERLRNEATEASERSEAVREDLQSADHSNQNLNQKENTMYSETSESTPLEQATPETQNHGGETMGDQTKQDQNAEPQEEVKEKVTPKNLEDYLIPIEGANPETGVVTINKVDYDGSKTPMIVVQNLSSSKAINNAMLRIKVRYNYLMKEYFRLKDIVEDESQDTIVRKLAIDDIGNIDKALESIKNKKKEVEAQKTKVEKKVEKELVNPDVSLENSFKF